MFPVIWFGFIQLSRVTIPVEAYAALNAQGSRITARLLHDECHNRIRLKKYCPRHGELGSDEIVKGFEHHPGQFTVLDPSELLAIRPAANTTLALSAFFPLRCMDPIYLSGRGYYLVPIGHAAQQAYRTLKQAMLEERVCAESQIVIRRRQYVVVLSPVGRLMTLSTVHFANSIRAAAMFPQDPVVGPIAAKQLQAAKESIRARLVDRPQFGKHPDPYQQRLRELIQTKITQQQTIAQNNRP